jgi:glycosyltransferase involved in cell wall biosynthesis
LNIVSGAPSGCLNVALIVARYLSKYYHCDIFLRKYNKAGIKDAVVVYDRFVLDYIVGLWKILKAKKYDIILVHGYSTHLWTKVAAGISNTSLIHVEHNVERYTWFRAMLLRLLDRYTARYVCVSQGVAKHLLNLGIDHKKIEVILNGIDLEEFIVAKQPQPRFTIGMTARFSKQKDQMTLIKAVEHLVRAKGYNLGLIFQGDGKTLRPCEEYVTVNKLESNITFEKGRFINLAPRLDLFVLSTWYEGLPLVICEAMAARIPVIASNVPGVDEMIVNRENGYLVEPGNYMALADCIENLLCHKDNISRITDMAMRTVEEKFNVNIMLKKYAELVNKIC